MVNIISGEVGTNILKNDNFRKLPEGKPLFRKSESTVKNPRYQITTKQVLTIFAGSVYTPLAPAFEAHVRRTPGTYQRLIFPTLPTPHLNGKVFKLTRPNRHHHPNRICSRRHRRDHQTPSPLLVLVRQANDHDLVLVDLLPAPFLGLALLPHVQAPAAGAGGEGAWCHCVGEG